MFGKRVLTAVIGAPLFLAGLYYGGTVWRLLVLLVVVTGIFEFAKMAGEDIYLDYVLLSGLSFVFLTFTGLDGQKILIWLALQSAYYLVRSCFDQLRGFSASFNLLAVFYIAVSFSFLVLVRERFGMLWTLFGLVVTWLTDTGAYFGGSRYGKRQLAAKISPRKTVEGALCGLFTAILGGVIFALVTEAPVFRAGLLALILSICAQVGDLVESSLKRERLVKDSGKLLPGHGGLLDRFDSLAFVFPALFILLVLILG